MLRFFIALLVGALISASADAAKAPERQCAIGSAAQGEQDGGKVRCPELGPFHAISLPDLEAVRSDSGLAATPIDVWNRCRYVDNYSGDKSFFVPFRSAPEWFAFILNAPPELDRMTCARPATLSLEPSAECDGPAPASQPVSLPYARTGTVIVKSAAFACAPAEAGCPGWTQRVENSFTALNADVDDPSWLAGAPSYAGSPPDPETCGMDGVCAPGPDPASYAPGEPPSPAQLCLAGDVAGLTEVAQPGNHHFYWTCMGVNGGTDADCRSQILPDQVAGACGPANGAAVASAPLSGLCAAGDASPVSGSGPWTWTCAGIGGGTDAQCQSPIRCTPRFYRFVPGECTAPSLGWAEPSYALQYVQIYEDCTIESGAEPASSDVAAGIEANSYCNGPISALPADPRTLFEGNRFPWPLPDFRTTAINNPTNTTFWANQTYWNCIKYPAPVAFCPGW
jgi:hypothetical protein